MAKYLNWNGVANSLGKLKELSEPSYFEKLQDKAYVERIEDEHKNTIEETEDKFAHMYDLYWKVQEKKNDIETNLGTISGELNLLYKPDAQSNPENVMKILNENDWSNLDHLNSMNDDLTDAVYDDLAALNQQSLIYDNAAFGSQLFKQERNTGGYYLDENGNKVSHWDINKDAFVSEAELEKALNGTIKMLSKEHKAVYGTDFDSRGIREGFWSGYNTTSKVKEELEIKDKIATMVNEGKADLSPHFTAYLDAKKQVEKKKWVDNLNEEQYFNEIDTYTEQYFSGIEEIKDMDAKQEGTGGSVGPKGGVANEHWQPDPSTEGAWVKTQLRKDLEKSNSDLLTQARSLGYEHYFLNLPEHNFDNSDDNKIVAFEGEGPNGRRVVSDFSWSDIGFSYDFYDQLGKIDKIPVWQDMGMEIDTDGDGVPDASGMVQAHTAFFEKAEGKEWAMKFKKEFEFAQQFLENIHGTVVTDPNTDYQSFKNTGAISDDKAKRFNEIVDTLWKAFPQHFRGKTKLQVEVKNINKDPNQKRYYFLYKAN